MSNLYEQLLSIYNPATRWLNQSLKPFLMEWVQEPRNIGALCPSSRNLTFAMAEQVTIGNGYHIELGAGTGVVTRSLLEKGIPSNKLIVIERSPRFVSILKKQFPTVKIIEGDATNLCTILSQEVGTNIQIESIVSSLPLRSLPKEVNALIINQWIQLLNNNGQLIQFSYHPFYHPLYRSKHFEVQSSKLVLANFPPAKVYCYKPFY